MADVTAPLLISATIGSAGETLTLVFNEAVQFGSGDIGDFDFSASGGGLSISTYDSGTGTATISATLNRTVLDAETITFDYTQPGNGVEDAAGNDLASISSQAVTNNSTQTGGGGYDYSQESGFDGLDGNLVPTTIVWGEITLTATAYDQLGIHIAAVNYPGTIRLILYDAAGTTKVADALTGTISTTGWTDVAVSLSGLTPGTYKCAYIGQDNDALEVSFSDSAGTSYWDADQPGTGAAPSAIPAHDGSFTGRMGFRARKS